MPFLKLYDFLFHFGIYFVYLLLYFNGFAQGSDDPAIARRIVHVFAFTVFQIFVQNLIPADVIVPHLRCDAFKIFVFVDVNALLILLVDDFFNPVVRAAALVSGNRRV